MIIGGLLLIDARTAFVGKKEADNSLTVLFVFFLGDVCVASDWNSMAVLVRPWIAERVRLPPGSRRRRNTRHGVVIAVSVWSFWLP